MTPFVPSSFAYRKSFLSSPFLAFPAGCLGSLRAETFLSSPFLAFLLAFLLHPSFLAAQTPHPFFSKHPDQETRLRSLLQDAGLRSLPFQPLDLSLPLVDTEQDRFYSLSKHRGHVLLLTRWATWCSACKAELPSKIQLASTLAKERFALIGISNEDRDTLRSFASSSPSYPISLLDPQDASARFFPGSGIPVTLLVDPWGWVVALHQGSAPWSSPPILALLRFLLSIAPDAKRLLPSVPPPSVSFPSPLRASVGQVIPLRFSLQWTGEIDKFSRLLFRLPKHPSLLQHGLQTSGITSSSDGNTRHYTLPLVVSTPGRLTLQPLLLTYWIKDYDEHFQTEIGSLTLDISASPSSALTSPLPLLVVIASGLLLLVLFAFLARRAKP